MTARAAAARAHACQASCSDLVLNASETDIDCGGPCQKCGDGEKCLVAKDCVSGVCGVGMKCAPPVCDDTVLNGSESDTDCGGSCQPCADTRVCHSGTIA